MKNKLVITIFIFIFLAILTIVLFALLSEGQKMHDINDNLNQLVYEEYIDSKLGIKFDYYSDWKIIYPTDWDIYSLVLSLNSNQGIELDVYRHGKFDEEIDLVNWLDTNTDIENMVSRTEQNKNGYSGYTQKINYQVISYYIQKDNYIWEFAANIDSQSFTDSEKIITDFFNSIEFINQKHILFESADRTYTVSYPTGFMYESQDGLINTVKYASDLDMDFFSPEEYFLQDYISDFSINIYSYTIDRDLNVAETVDLKDNGSSPCLSGDNKSKIILDGLDGVSYEYNIADCQIEDGEMGYVQDIFLKNVGDDQVFEIHIFGLNKDIYNSYQQEIDLFLNSFDYLDN